MFSCPPSINKNKDLENWNSNIWRLWCREQVTKKQDFWPRLNILKGKNWNKKFLWWISVQKLGIILENNVVQKLKLENNVFNKRWSPKLTFLKINLSIFEMENWLCKYNVVTFWRTVINRQIVFILVCWFFAENLAF